LFINSLTKQLGSDVKCVLYADDAKPGVLEEGDRQLPLCAYVTRFNRVGGKNLQRHLATGSNSTIYTIEQKLAFARVLRFI